MSEKAVGFDWLKKKIPTLRHSTGCAKFTGIKSEAEQEQKKAQQNQTKTAMNTLFSAAIITGLIMSTNKR